MREDERIENSKQLNEQGLILFSETHFEDWSNNFEMMVANCTSMTKIPHCNCKKRTVHSQIESTMRFLRLVFREEGEV